MGKPYEPLAETTVDTVTKVAVFSVAVTFL
jgi:hypothetical protein